VTRDLLKRNPARGGRGRARDFAVILQMRQPENKPSNHLIQAQNNLRLKLLASRLHTLVRSVAPSLPLLGGLAMNEPSVYAGCPTKRNRASLFFELLQIGRAAAIGGLQ
jgi:hypothetical protein